MDAIDDLRDLYTEQAPTLTRVIGSMTRDREAAEDIVQEAFLRLTRELAEGRRPDNPAAWVAQVARHLAISRHRRAASAARLAPRLASPATEVDPADAILEGERADAVHRALATLPPVERVAVILAAEGMHGPEIAAHLGRTQLATRALLFRARRRMRPHLLALAEAH